MRGSPASAQAAAAAAATASWKAAAISARGRPGGEVVEGTARRGRRRVAERDRHGYGSARRVAGELLELDRRLALVA